MITKLWSLLMLKLSRIIVAIKNAFRKKLKKPSEEAGTNEANIKTEKQNLIKEFCKSHDYCEECLLYEADRCMFADDDKGIPCYWEVDE